MRTDLVLSVKARDSRAHNGVVGVRWGQTGKDRQSKIRCCLIVLDIG